MTLRFRATLLLALTLALAPATGVYAQETPTDLWDEYPLGETGRSAPPQDRATGEADAAQPRASEEDGGGGTGVLPFAGAALLGLLVGGAALVAVRRRRPAPAAAPPRQAEKPETKERRGEEPSLWGPSAKRTEPGRALGYTSFAGADAALRADTQGIAQQIEAACEARGLTLERLVGDVASGPDLKRPGLTHALESLSEGDIEALVVADLARLSHSAIVLGTLVRWLRDRHIRLVVIDIGLDTAQEDGRRAANALVSVGDLEREKLRRRTGQAGAPERGRPRPSGRPSVADRPELKKRIVTMRANGMTLQAIADTLNDEGVPTLRGGVKWRPSSVQSAAGYKRPARKPKPNAPASGRDRALE